MNDKVKGFALHFTGRSGSTFLIYTLRKHPQIQARAEVFGNAMLPGELEQTADNQVAFLRKYWRNYKIGSDVHDSISRGFKVQIIKDRQQLKSIGRYIKVCEGYDVAKMFLYRRNHVKQIISSLRAQQVKALTQRINQQESAHVFDEVVAAELKELPMLSIRPHELKKRLISLKANYKILDDMRDKMGESLVLYYEDALMDRQAFFDKIFYELGVPSVDVTDTDETKKITSDNLRDVIENYDELMTFFAGSEYESQLQE